MRRSGWGAVVFVGAIVAAGLASPPSASFSDVAEHSYARGDIGCLVELGITTGTSRTTFSPTAPVTREQMVTFMARLYSALAG